MASGSNFNEATRNSAAWIHGGEECRNDGRSVVYDVAAGLRDQLESQALPGLSGVITQDSVPGDSSGWSFGMLQALYAVARSFSRDKVPADYVSAIQADLAAIASHRAISARTLQVAIWLAYHSTGFRGATRETEVLVHDIGSPTTISFPSGTVFPIGGSVPPMAANGVYNDRVCTASGSAPRIPPRTVPGVVDRSVPLLMALLVAGALGISFITNRLPRRSQLRKNPRRRR